MRAKKKFLKYKKERVILSDVLPYELPITFSNRHFYEFLLENNVYYKDEKIYWEKSTETLDTIVKLLFGIHLDKETNDLIIPHFEKDITFNFSKPQNESIPFCYLISHKEKEYRELKLCHPRHQIKMVEFYDEFKELILFFSNKSSFSIRKPNKVAKYIYHKDKAHYDSLSDEKGGIEEAHKEYENMKSFFVYKDYSNIYKFYESYKYHRCEKKYNNLIKLDISKCFDSIYTHSLAWAIYSKESTKENLDTSKKTFADKFDKLMQSLNYNETNGIVIGPEFSRIFAELILQSVDKYIENVLSKPPYSLKHKTDYEIFRYVDDYFIFYNSNNTKDDILKLLQIRLKDFKLYLNNSKALLYEKPIITEISMAKNKIAKLLEDKIGYKIETFETLETDENGEEKTTLHRKGNIYLNSNSLITEFKTILKSFNVQYKDLLNYSLAIIERKSIKIIKDYHSIVKNKNSEQELTRATLELLDFTFFIYSVSPRVNTTIKLCRILRVFISFLKKKESNHDFKHIVFKKIYDDLCFILKKNKNTEHTQVETLYLLVVLSELGKEYWLDLELLCSYFDINLEDNKPIHPMNYLTIVVLLFYIKDKKRYIPVKEYLKKVILHKFDKNHTLLDKDTELTLLLFDCIVCPYLPLDFKKELLKCYDITDQNMQEMVVDFRPSQDSPYWFTKWTDFDFGKELDAKKSQEVY